MNKEQQRDYNKKYYQKNKEKRKEDDKEYYIKNKSKILKRIKENRYKYKDKFGRDYRRKIRSDNLEVYRDYGRKWRAKNPKYPTNYYRLRVKRDKVYKLTCYIKSRMKKALKGVYKSASSLKLLGCSVVHLKEYLEKQFKPRMSWKNYGKWHIDHIKPCCSFDLSKPKEQLKCFNYRNLQPLWAEENWSKNGKY